ncbi:MAG: ABC transporter permease [Cyclobacteriaceae bacterium]|nr:ABC transporter permease [Cyclobacteriaceae bacterium]
MKNRKTYPPQLPLRFFRWFCHPKLRDSIEGDLMELYEERKVQSGKLKADAYFIKDVLLLFRPGIIKPTEGYQQLNAYGMYKNYFVTAWRNITSKRAHAAINVFGLALGIACALLIFSLVRHHLDFDKFHAQADRIYRFVTEEHHGEVEYSPNVPPAFGKAFRDDYAFGEKVTRLCTLNDKLVTLDENGEKRKFQEQVAFADPEFFEIFNFPLDAGKADGLLREPNTAVITGQIAKKYFGDQLALGKIIRLGSDIDFTVVGVLKDIPAATDLNTEIYFSYSTMKQYNDWYAADDAWGGITSEIQVFTRLQPGVNPTEVEAVLPTYVQKYRPKSKNVHHYKMQALSDMHFNAQYGGKMSINTIWILSTIGFLLVFTACLNFINLATAQAVTRAKEVGVRKVMGGLRAQLFWQFTTEAGVIVVLATLLAFAASYTVLPFMNEFFNVTLSLNVFSDVRLLLFLILVIVAVTLLSGAYPGIVLSRFKPVLALKGNLKGGPGSFNIRRGLIIAQFTISQVLLIGLIVMFYQMRYVNKMDMGFDRDAVVMVPVGSRDQKLNTLKTQLEAIPHVEKVSACFGSPASENMWGTSFRFDTRTEAEEFPIYFKGGDEDYLALFGLELVAGRNVTASDTVREFLVNEKAVLKLGLASPEDILGKFMYANGGSIKGPIVGVVKDFHDQSLHAEIDPIFITTPRNFYNSYAIKINMAEAATTLPAIEKAWSSMYPEPIYHYDFLDDQIASFYKAEQTMLTVVQVFSAIALLIGCLGLYGLVSFMALQKTKEIGIRKVLGGSVPQILWIFGKEFSRLVVIAFFIAAPLGWLLMSQWLTGYVYKTEIGVGVFVLELLIILAIVMFTAGFRSLKAAVANPVDSLRSE